MARPRADAAPAERPEGASDDPRGRVVAAALELFAARGFDGTTIQDVADALRVSKPAVLHHFASKEALRAGVLDELLAHWNRVLPRLLVAATASDRRFDAVFGELTQYFFDHPARARVLLREAFDRPAAVRELIAGGVRPWLGAVAGYVRSGVERGRHHGDVDPEAYVAQVMLLVLTVSAAVDMMPAALQCAPAEATARARDELRRIARAALFPPAPALAAPKRASERPTSRSAPSGERPSEPPARRAAPRVAPEATTERRARAPRRPRS